MRRRCSIRHPAASAARQVGRKAQSNWSGLVITLLVAAPLGVIALSTAGALELPKPEPAEKYLGKATTGSNYTVKPIVRSDGVMRIFDVDTPYGKFAFDGVEFTKLRLHELDACAAIEKMSQSEAFGQAFGRAALGPIKFGADLITNPAGTVERSLNGISNMFDRVGAGLSNNRADRDGLMDSLLGVTDTQRELAVSLDVDPYTDFPPLAQRLKDMAGVMAGGSLPVKAGLSFVPGGIGIAVSSVATVSDARDTLRSKTAAQVIAEARAILLSLGVSDESASRLARESELYARRSTDPGARTEETQRKGYGRFHRPRRRGRLAQRGILSAPPRAIPCGTLRPSWAISSPSLLSVGNRSTLRAMAILLRLYG